MEQDPKEELLHIHAREKRYKVDAEARIADLLAQLAAVTEAKNRTEVNLSLTTGELKKRVTELKKGNAGEC